MFRKENWTLYIFPIDTSYVTLHCPACHAIFLQYDTRCTSMYSPWSFTVYSMQLVIFAMHRGSYLNALDTVVYLTAPVVFFPYTTCAPQIIYVLDDPNLFYDTCTSIYSARPVPSTVLYISLTSVQNIDFYQRIKFYPHYFFWDLYQVHTVHRWHTLALNEYQFVVVFVLVHRWHSL